MLFPDDLVIVRGGGDLGTGVVARLHRSGFPVIVLELEHPLTVRRTVAVSSAILDGAAQVEDLVALRVADPEQAADLAREGIIPVVVARTLPPVLNRVVVDARLAKRNMDTTIGDASLVVALGPGFSAGVDCHAVVETARGHHLGRVLWNGSALANTGTPGEVGGKGAERVLRADAPGIASWAVPIGAIVQLGQVLGSVGGSPIAAPFSGVVRGLIAEGTDVPAGVKVGDIDPRLDTNCDEISDKALAIGGGVLEAVMTWKSATN